MTVTLATPFELALIQYLLTWPSSAARAREALVSGRIIMDEGFPPIEGKENMFAIQQHSDLQVTRPPRDIVNLICYFRVQATYVMVTYVTYSRTKAG